MKKEEAEKREKEAKERDLEEFREQERKKEATMRTYILTPQGQKEKKEVLDRVRIDLAAMGVHVKAFEPKLNTNGAKFDVNNN